MNPELRVSPSPSWLPSRINSVAKCHHPPSPRVCAFPIAVLSRRRPSQTTTPYFGAFFLHSICPFFPLSLPPLAPIPQWAPGAAEREEPWESLSFPTNMLKNSRRHSQLFCAFPLLKRRLYSLFFTIYILFLRLPHPTFLFHSHAKLWKRKGDADTGVKLRDGVHGSSLVYEPIPLLSSLFQTSKMWKKTFTFRIPQCQILLLRWSLQNLQKPWWTGFESRETPTGMVGGEAAERIKWLITSRIRQQIGVICAIFTGFRGDDSCETADFLADHDQSERVF